MLVPDRHNPTNISALVGRTVKCVIVTRNSLTKDDSIVFDCTDGTSWMMYHPKDCCENVRIEDICMDADDIVGSPVVKAEECIQRPPFPRCAHGSDTWTFYRIVTNVDSITIRWYGTSNGYYSETAGFFPMIECED